MCDGGIAGVCTETAPLSLVVEQGPHELQKRFSVTRLGVYARNAVLDHGREPCCSSSDHRLGHSHGLQDDGHPCLEVVLDQWYDHHAGPRVPPAQVARAGEADL